MTRRAFHTYANIIIIASHFAAELDRGTGASRVVKSRCTRKSGSKNGGTAEAGEREKNCIPSIFFFLISTEKKTKEQAFRGEGGTSKPY